jgi:methyltransferase (TIGR00027 family)
LNESSGISQTGQVSRTAMMAASARGAHLVTHGPRAVLQDWLAWPLIGAEAETMAAASRAMFGECSPLLATWVSARSRITEDWLAASGARQYVVLGAGLDSFAWRQTGSVRVFEVDHPATQAWKRSRLEALGIPEPAELVWVPVDFEVESIAEGLSRAGLGEGLTFVSWLGVVSYLSLDGIAATLRGLPPCSLAVSHGTPRDTWPEDVLAVSKAFASLAVGAGEPPVSRFTSDQFAALLAEHRFAVVERAGAAEVEPRWGLPALAIGNERVVLAGNAS